MQVQNVTPQYSQPNFQARNLSRVVSTAKDGVKSVIDIYSVNKSDAAFLNRFAESLKGHQLPEDTFMIAGRDPKKSIIDSLKRASELEKYDRDGVLIAVEDKKNIAGVLDYFEHGDMDIRTLFMFKDDKQSLGRKGLLLQALKNIMKQKDFYAEIPSQNVTHKAHSYYNRLGFNSERKGDLFIDADKLAEKIDRIQSKSAIEVKDLKNGKNVDLTDVLKLDE